MFLYPIMLFGLFGLAVPIIIHLLNKRRYDRVQWAAMRFLKLATEQNQRRLRLEDLLLLLFRCALLALLALALARPAWHFAAGLTGKTSTTAVIVIDNSASMTGNDGVTSRFENAKQAAARIISELPAGSAVAILAASNRVDELIPQPTFELSLARKAVTDAVITDRSTNMLPAVRRSLEILKKAGGSRELFVITDGQHNGFAQLSDISQAMRDAKDDVSSRVILVGPAVSQNVAVSDLHAAGDLAPVNRPVRFEATLTNYGTADASDIPVQLRMDTGGANTAAIEQTIVNQLPAGQSKVVSLFGKLPSEGSHAVTVSIPADRQPADDQRTIVVRGTAVTRVLLVEGDTQDRDPDHRNGSTILRDALLPIPPDQIKNYFLKITTIDTAQLATARLEDYAAVFTCDVAAFDEKSAAQLADYVHHGGAMLIFPSPDSDCDNYNQRLLKQHPLLPAALGPARGDADQHEKFFTLQADHFQHPTALIWNDPVNGSPASAHFYKAFTLEPLGSGEAGVVMHFADNSPAIMQRDNVLLFSSTADTSWNDLADHGGIFVPLIYRSLANLLARKDAGLNLGVGDAYSRELSIDLLGRPVTVTDPAGLRTETTVDLQNQTAMVHVNDTPRAGVYTLKSKGTPPIDEMFACQADPNESRLELLSETEKAELAQVAQIINWTGDPAALESSMQSAHSADRWWIALAIAALWFAAAEPFVANWFSRSR